jgi:hypothetical protein
MCCGETLSTPTQSKPAILKPDSVDRVLAQNNCDYWLWHRALNEAGRTPTNGQRQQLLMQLLLNRPADDAFYIARALAKTPGSLKPLIAKVKIENEAYSRVLLLLSFRGKDASDCADWVKTVMNRTDIAGTVKAQSHVVLWKMGVEKDRNAVGIRTLIASHTTEGYDVVSFLTATGGCDLVDAGLCKELASRLDKGDLNSMQAAMLLGRCGDVAKPALPRLLAYLKSAEKDEERRTKYLVVAIAVANLTEGEEQDAVLRRVCSRIADPQQDTEMRVFPSLMQIASPKVVRWMGAHVDDSDDAVASGAIIAVTFVGLECGAYANRLIGVVKSGRSNHLRALAAATFGVVGDESNAHALAELLSDEPSSEVRDAISKGLKILQLDCGSPSSRPKSKDGNR